MNQPPFKLGHLTVDPGEMLVRNEQDEHRLEPRLMKLLVLLVERAGSTVTKEEIIAQVWGDTHVSADAVNVAIYSLRKALGDRAREPEFIQTIRKVGFKMLVTPQPLTPELTEAPPLPQEGEDPNPAHTPEKPHVHKFLYPMLVVVALLIIAYLMFGLNQNAPPEEPAAIAILPLAYMAEDQEQAYFADGMSEALITDLARATSLRVLPRRRTQLLAGSPQSAREIGALLEVDLLLEGAVQLLDDQVVVTLQVIEAEDERHLWTRTYKKNIRDYFRIQAEASLDLIRFFTGEQSTDNLPHYPDRKLGATTYHAYLKGRHLLNENKPGSAEKAVTYFKQVLKTAPDFAPAHASLSTCYVLFGQDLDHLTREEASDLAQIHISRGLLLDPGIAELHVAQGVLLFRDQWQFESAEKSFREALRLHPTSPTAHAWYARLLIAEGRGDEALEHSQNARYLAPDSAVLGFNHGLILLYLGRIKDAKHLWKQLILEHPHYGEAYLYLFLLEQHGKEANNFFADFREWVSRLEMVPLTYDQLNPIDSLSMLSPKRRAINLRRRGLNETVSPVTLAYFNLYSGDEDNALAWLKKAVDQRDPQALYLQINPLFRDLQQYPTFTQLLNVAR